MEAATAEMDAVSASSATTHRMPRRRCHRAICHTGWTITIVGLFVLLSGGGNVGSGGGAEAHILVYRRLTGQLIEEYNDLPAQFGAPLTANGLRVFAVPITNYGCGSINPIPNKADYPDNAKFVAIVERGGGDNCTFEKKVRTAQLANYSAVIVFNNNSDELEIMSTKNATGITISAVFVGHTTGINLCSFSTPDTILVINSELPFNINTQLIIPFSILMGLCFLTMIFYMIYKCIREQRRLRRHRLPKHMLKKLPILKYTKNTELSYDTCVICLEEFVEGDKLRVLPCRHPYHSHCIDPWLTENKRICPVCKRKVFTKGDVRANRNRQSSLDSVTDTDDDTTPLLQPSNNQRRVIPGTRAVARAPLNATATRPSSTDANQRASATATTTRHGTFQRHRNEASASVSADGTSDEENVLLANPTSAQNAGGAARVNPFDRTPNLPRHLAEQLSDNRRSFWSPLRFFTRRPQVISVAAPPYLEEVVHDNNIHTNARLPTSATAAATTVPAPPTQSNNILNPNLSGSFKDDDDDEPSYHSIYEPIVVVTPVEATNTATTSNAVASASASVATGTPVETTNTPTNDNAMADVDSLFVQTPSQGGIGVVALPNTNNFVQTSTPTSSSFPQRDHNWN